MSDILDKIVAVKRKEVPAARALRSEAALRRMDVAAEPDEAPDSAPAWTCRSDAALRSVDVAAEPAKVDMFESPPPSTRAALTSSSRRGRASGSASFLRSTGGTPASAAQLTVDASPKSA